MLTFLFQISSGCDGGGHSKKTSMGHRGQKVSILQQIRPRVHCTPTPTHPHAHLVYLRSTFLVVPIYCTCILITNTHLPAYIPTFPSTVTNKLPTYAPLYSTNITLTSSPPTEFVALPSFTSSSAYDTTQGLEQRTTYI